jgi:hypothetical protein
VVGVVVRIVVVVVVVVVVMVVVVVAVVMAVDHLALCFGQVQVKAGHFCIAGIFRRYSKDEFSNKHQYSKNEFSARNISTVRTIFQ